MKVKCYTRWNKTELKCLCKVGNTACDRYKSCIIEKFHLIQFTGLQECFKNSEKRR